ncbi:MAG: biopolymer transporter ExbD [Bacteriovoracaceae bacterium]|nr:biopolymer transporter ExbD [Bacteriovoracaceae bacterium]
MRARHAMKKPEKINLVPIMDAVFIFIFFLLMSAQFVNVYEIGSSVPMVREVREDKVKKDPLNLVIEVFPNEVIVKKGKDGVKVGSYSDTEWPKLRSVLADLKSKHPDERVAMLRPQGKVAFHRLVKVIDHAKENPGTKSKMFEEIVFDGKGSL